jgi:DNA gyrase/topoisomerase IV subunit B
MNWQELKASTMSTDNRVLIQLTNDDLAWCEQILDTCMNDKSIANRKEFIMSDDVYELV